MRRAALIVLACVAACAAQQKKDAVESLRESVDAYNHAFRWKVYDHAVQFLPTDVRGPFLVAYEDEESSLQVEEYRILRVQMHNDTTATITIRIRFMMMPSVIVQKETLIQHWAKLGASWILESEENSIRELDMDATPKHTAEASEPPPEALGETELKVLAPGEKDPDEKPKGDAKEGEESTKP